MFPKILDWRSEHNELRHAEYKNITWQEWVWFSPYLYIYINIIYRLFYIVPSLYCIQIFYIKNEPSMSFLSFLGFFILLWIFVYHTWKYCKLIFKTERTYNFYDKWLKDS